MEQPTQTTSPSIYFRIFRFVGIYVLAVSLIVILAKKELFVNVKINPIFLFLYLAIFLPLVWSLSKNFLVGFVKYALLLGAILIIGRVLPEGRNSNTFGTTNDNINYEGRYSGDENGIQIKLIVGNTKWYGEVIEGNTGGLISNQSGEVKNNKLFDQYDNEIGEIRNNKITISIQGQRVKLTKD